LFPELEYTFKHALTLEVAYQSLLRERRRLLHTGVLAALEARERGHAPESVEVLAHHAVRGEVWTSAASYLYRAGAKAQAEARYGTAVTFYEAGVDALPRLGGAAGRHVEVGAYLEVGGALGRFDAALASATEALRMATEIRHASSLSIANAFLGYLKLLQGDLEAAVVALTRGLAIAEEHDLMHGVCANGLYLAWASLLGGDRARGLEYLERGLERPAGAQLQWTRFGSVPAAVYLAAGRPDEARPIIARGLADVAERD